MRLTSFTDFALRTLMRLAGEPERLFATNEIAAEFRISRNHLAKVVRDLADGEFIATQRGAGGGFSLARPPQSITLGEVVRALEGGMGAGQMLQGRWRRLRADTPLPPEKAAGACPRGLHARARCSNACRMHLLRAVTTKGGVVTGAASLGRSYPEACWASFGVVKEMDVSGVAAFISRRAETATSPGRQCPPCA